MNFFPANRRTYAAIVLALVAVIFFALNMFASSAFRMSRIDLTQGGVYTTAKATRDLLAGLKEPITLRLYYSEKVATNFPSERARAEHVQDMLREFAALANGNLIVEVVKPEPYSPQEDQASAAGISGIPTESGERIFFGLEASNRADGHEVIPYFTPDREPLYEYDLVSLIDRLSRGGKPKVALITSLALENGAGGAQAAMRGAGQPYAIYDQLRKSYDLVTLQADVQSIPDDVRVLVLAHPYGLTENALYAIDQYVMRGGRVLAFDDPLSEMMGEMGMGDPGPAATSDFGPLLKSWGVDVPSSEVVGDAELAQRVMVGNQSDRILDYLPWLALTGDNVNSKDPVVADLNLIDLGTAGHIVALKDATTTVTPMLTTTAQSMVIQPDALRYSPDPEALLRNFAASGEKYVLAARITGPAKTAFPNGPPPPPEGAAMPSDAGKDAQVPPAEQIKEAQNGINVILIADSDILDDKFWVDMRSVQGQRVAVPNAANGTLVENAIDNLLGSDALLSLRGRTIPDRRFEVVDEIKRKADQRYLAAQDQLRQKLTETEQRLATLEQQGGADTDDNYTVTPEQRQAIASARAEITQTRAKLRAVQLELRKDIDALYAWLRILNIAVAPIIVALAGVVMFVLRRRRRLALSKTVTTSGAAS